MINVKVRTPVRKGASLLPNAQKNMFNHEEIYDAKKENSEIICKLRKEVIATQMSDCAPCKSLGCLEHKDCVVHAEIEEKTTMIAKLVEENSRLNR